MSKVIQLQDTPLQKVVAQCSGVLQQGGVIGVPTDTVYGLIGLWNHRGAIERMYSLKSRDEQKPFAVFTDSWQRIQPLLVQPCVKAEQLSRRFWDGGLTILVPVKQDCPCAQNGKLGVRSPAYPLLHRLIQALDRPLANTSFNLSNEPALAALPAGHPLIEQVDLMIDAGDLGVPVPSTVVDCCGTEVVVLREGVISKADITQALQHQ